LVHLVGQVKSSYVRLILDSGQDEGRQDLCEGNLELLAFGSGAVRCLEV
jgi:hypothetical protein